MVRSAKSIRANAALINSRVFRSSFINVPFPTVSVESEEFWLTIQKADSSERAKTRLITLRAASARFSKRSRNRAEEAAQDLTLEHRSALACNSADCVLPRQNTALTSSPCRDKRRRLPAQ